MFFWSDRSGRAASAENGSGLEEQEMAEQVEALHDLSDVDFKVPHVMSSQDNWRPKAMLPLKEFCYAIDS